MKKMFSGRYLSLTLGILLGSKVFFMLGAESSPSNEPVVVIDSESDSVEAVLDAIIESTPCKTLLAGAGNQPVCS